MRTETPGSWVVYKKTLHGNDLGRIAVCTAEEWDALLLAQPGQHKLIQAGITNEGEAERIARAAPGGTGQAVRLKPRPP
jgi:hypothetical protein